jgi:bla regulator protein blaR1
MNIEQVNAGSELLIDALWRASWQGTLAAILVWTTCRALPKIAPRIRSWLWRLVFLKFVFTFLWLAPVELPIFRATLPAQTPALTHTINSAQVASALDNSAVPNSPTQLSAKTVSQPIAVPAIFAWHSVLAALWLSGVLLATSRLLWQFVQARKLPATAAPCTDSNLTHALNELSQKLSLRFAPQLFISTAASRPLLIGIRKPIIILPREVVTHSSLSSIEMMIAHELAHIRRGDLAWTLASALIQALFFFHPALWFARREYALAQEIACDELAITAISREQHAVTAYAEMLLQIVATSASRTAPTHFTLGVADAKRTLERRIRSMNLIHEKRTKIAPVVAAIATAFLLLLQVPVSLVSARRNCGRCCRAGSAEP